MLDQLETELKAAAKRRSPARLQESLRKGSYVYGAGSFGRRMVELLRQQGFACHGVIDRRAGNGLQEVAGLPAIHPDVLTPQMCRGRNFILGIFNPFDDMGEIVAKARTFGFDEILWGADLPDALGPSLNDFWLSGRQVFIDNFDDIRKAVNIFADQTSIDTLSAVVRFRALDDDKPNPSPSFGTQYLPSDLPGFDRPITFLDGGAYDGDTFRSLQNFGVKIDNWIAFEPDPANFQKLTVFGQNSGVRGTFIPCGLSDRLAKVSFAAGGDTGSRILDEASRSDTVIQCVAFDEVISGMPIDYVKLDIEGAEGAALRGMAEMVTKYRPRLAVSAYHRPEDLWEIPLQLKTMLPDSDIFLRHHYPNTYEIVAYAIARNI